MNTEVNIDIQRVVPVADGYGFGDVGSYERLIGNVHFAVDPRDAMNDNVVDLGLASTDARGYVEFNADLDILKPKDLSKGNGRLFYDVNNRGNKTVLRAFNDAGPDNDPLALPAFGNGFLLRQGFTIVWSGWQGDLLPGDGLLTCDLPEALSEGKRLRGMIRQEFIVDQEGVLSMPLSGATNIRNYETIDLNAERAVMTRRELERDNRQPLHPSEWAFAKALSVPGEELSLIPSASHCYVVGGFRPGWIYELIYETEGSRVMGLGITGIRDLVTFLRYENEDRSGTPNPLADRTEKAFIYGQSLSARVVRQFIYDGYNVDALGRRAFDGVYTHVSGGGRLFANARFSQVGRYPRQHEEHQWPSERYPFAYSAVPDAFSDKIDSVLKRPDSDPLVMHTHTNTEYWNRHASLGHTDPSTGVDLEIPASVRMYFLASAQHMGSALAGDDVGQKAQNRMSNGPLMRAAFVALDRWATDDVAPPPSVVPRRDEGTLISHSKALELFPNVTGFDPPMNPSRLPLYDYGPDFDRGYVTQQPPQPVPGKEYPVQVPAVDGDGNDLGGIRSPEIMVPVGTHTGWNLRRKGFAEGDLASLTGSFVPFRQTQEEREHVQDPRPSLQERYGSHSGYIDAMKTAAMELETRGFLLHEDVTRYIVAAENRNPLDPKVSIEPLVLPH